MTTKEQRLRVLECEMTLDVIFKGDINNYIDVSSFLRKYYHVAKKILDRI